MYIGAARSLADGQGYREPALPGNPWQTKFPPGYPLMLAAILQIKPNARDFAETTSLQRLVRVWERLKCLLSVSC